MESLRRQDREHDVPGALHVLHDGKVGVDAQRVLGVQNGVQDLAVLLVGLLRAAVQPEGLQGEEVEPE